MSLPSIPEIVREKRLDLNALSTVQQEDLLVEAMRRDLPRAVELFTSLATQARTNPEKPAVWDQNDPMILKEVGRILAADALRPLAVKHFLDGLPLTFINCHRILVGIRPPDLLLLQIQCQVGPVAYADC
jgi:hypothetical protein